MRMELTGAWTRRLTAGLCLALLATSGQAATLGGVVFEDRDRSGVFDGTDTPLRNARVLLVGVEGSVVRQTRSAVDGTWSFIDLPDGDYVVSIEARGFRHSLPDPSAVASPIPDFPFGSPRYSTFERLVRQLRTSSSFTHIGLGDSIGFGFNFCGSLLGEDGYFEPTTSRLGDAAAPPVVADKQSIPGHETNDLLEPGASGDFPFTNNDIFYTIDEGADLVSISIGGNDFLGAEDGGDPAVASALVTARRNIQEILSSLVTELPDASIEINTVYDNEEGGDGLHNVWVPIWDQVLRETAWAQDRPVRIAEIYPEYRHDAEGTPLGEPGLICNDLFGFDGIHPTNSGYDVHEQKLWQSIGGVTLAGADRLDVNTGFQRPRRLLLPLAFDDVTGDTVNPTDALSTDDVGALVPSDNAEFRVETFLNNPPGALGLLQALVKVRYRTTGAPIDDFYRIEASIDGTFSAPGSTPSTWNTILPIVGSSGNGSAEILAYPDQPNFRTVAAPLYLGAPTSNAGTLDWPDLQSLSVRVVTTAVGSPDAFSVELDSAWVEAFTTLPGGSVARQTSPTPVRSGAPRARPSRDTEELLAELAKVAPHPAALDQLVLRAGVETQLVAAVQSRDRISAPRAAKLLGRREAASLDVLAALRGALAAELPALRAAAIDALGTHGDLESASLIAREFDNPQLAVTVARALGRLDSRTTLETLYKTAAAPDASPTARRSAARALAASKHAGATRWLELLSATDNERVRRLAASGLTRLTED